MANEQSASSPEKGLISLWPSGEATGSDGAPQAARAQAGTDADINLAMLLRILMQWRWLIIGGVVGGLLLAVVATLLATPVYRSTSILEVNPPRVEVIDDGAASGVETNDRAFLATQFGLLKSRSLADRVAQDLNLASNGNFVDQDLDRPTRQKIAVAQLLENLDVEEMDESRLIRVAFNSEDPSLAALIVNGFGEAFVATSLERRYQASAYARNFLENQIAKVREELEGSERKLITYAQQQGIISTQSEGEESDAGALQRATLINLNDELAASQARRIAAEKKYRESLRGRPSREQDSSTQQLRIQRDIAEAEYEQKLRLFQPDYPEMVQMRAQIDALNRAIAAASQSSRSAESGSLEAAFRAAAAEESEIRDRVDQLKSEVLNLRSRSVQYNILQREVDTNRSLYDALLQRYKEVGVAAGVGNSHVSIVDRGDVPEAPSEPDLIINLLVGLLLGFAGGFGLALALEFINDTVKSPDDVRERLGLSFIGAIPASRGNQPLQDLQEQGTPLAEAYFSAATALRFSSEKGVPEVLLMSSTRPAEGKSTTSWALANQYANLGRQVLLIDADMRKPTFVTDSEDVGGLSTLLSSQTPLKDYVSPTDIKNLWLLPSGPLPPNPGELLSAARLKEVLDEARQSFDLVLVDGPPVLGLADSPLLARACDGTLIVIESGKTRTKAAVEALNRLRQAGANVIGVLLSRYKEESEYGYNYDAYEYKSDGDSQRKIRAMHVKD